MRYSVNVTSWLECYTKIWAAAKVVSMLLTFLLTHIVSTAFCLLFTMYYYCCCCNYYHYLL